MFTNNLTKCFRRSIGQIVQMSTSVTTPGFTFKPRFSEEDQQKILTTLNHSDIEQLAKYDVTQVRIKNLENWKVKYGPFQSLSDILEVEGLGEKVLERLCNSIVYERPDSPAKTAKSVNHVKNRRNILSPQLDEHLAHVLKSAVGIHLAPTGISWAKLSIAQNELEAWDYHNFSSLPKKLLPTDTFDLALTLLSKIPVGDVYVMEAPPHQQAGNGSSLPSYNQHLELSSMLLALLNTSPKHNCRDELENVKELQFVFENKVYYLRANIPARLFRTLVGKERVAVTGIITKLLENDNTLPCTAITVKPTVRDFYTAQNAVHREIMGQSVMLAVSFMDLCVYKNPISTATLSSRKLV